MITSASTEQYQETSAYPVVEPLTAREHEVIMIWLESGTTKRDLADELCISEGTVNTHLANIYSKLGVSKRREAARVYRSIYGTNAAMVPARPQAPAQELPGQEGRMWSFLSMPSPFRVVGAAGAA